MVDGSEGKVAGMRRERLVAKRGYMACKVPGGVEGLARADAKVVCGWRWGGGSVGRTIAGD